MNKSLAATKEEQLMNRMITAFERMAIALEVQTKLTEEMAKKFENIMEQALSIK